MDPAHPKRAAILEAARALHLESTGSSSPAWLISQLCDERLNCDQLAARIESHPVLCARVLQVANSPYYGQARSIASIKRALLLLGINAVRGIAAAACIRQVIPRGGSLPNLPAFMKHSLATAVACDGLANVAALPLAPEAFIAGLLHNLGTVIQTALDPTGTAALIAARSADPSRDLREVELQYSEAGHESCAAVLFDAWNLPECLTVSAQYHHAPEAARDPHQRLAGLVWAGSHLALCCEFTYCMEPHVPARDHRGLLQLGFSPEQIELVAAELVQRVESLSRPLLA